MREETLSSPRKHFEGRLKYSLERGQLSLAIQSRSGHSRKKIVRDKQNVKPHGTNGTRNDIKPRYMRFANRLAATRASLFESNLQTSGSNSLCAVECEHCIME